MSQLPPWLASPLSSPRVFEAIDHALATREQQRRECAKKVQMGDAGGRKRLPTRSRGPESAAGGDIARFSTSEGLKDEHVKKNR